MKKMPNKADPVLGIERLVVQIKEVIAQSGNPQNFDAERWVNEWITHPLPALGGAMPMDYMDTIEGQKLISDLIAQIQSGAYA